MKQYFWYGLCILYKIVQTFF